MITRREFEAAEQQILRDAPSTLRTLCEVKLRIAREKLAAGCDVDPDIAALRRDLLRQRVPRESQARS